MRVIHIITRLELGGAQQNTLYTLANLDRRRFSPLLVTHPEGILAGEAQRGGYDTVGLPALVRELRPHRDLMALQGLYRILRREVQGAGPGQPLIVHTHSSKAGILGRIAARMARVPVVIHSIHGFGFHDRQSPGLRFSYIALEKMVSSWTDHFIAVSLANIEEGVSLGLFGRDKVTLIRSGIDIEAFRGGNVDRRAKRASLGVDPERKLVGMVACFKPQKNPVDFVRLAALVVKDVPEAEFVMAGDGELRPAVEEAVRRSGLEGRVRLLGWRRDIEEIIPVLDVLVLTSLWEGLPRVFPQAMAAARPIVAYRVNGAPEAVADGESGFLVEPGDFAAAAARVVELLRNGARAAALGAAGAARVAPFDAGLMVRQQEDLYTRLARDLRQ